MTHSNEDVFVGPEGNSSNCFPTVSGGLTACFFIPDYSKRVYQGVRVKHTVKDLLAEKRSRQTTGSRYNVRAAAAAAFVRLSPPRLSRQTKHCARRSVGVAFVDVFGSFLWTSRACSDLGSTIQRSSGAHGGGERELPRVEEGWEG